MIQRKEHTVKVKEGELEKYSIRMSVDQDGNIRGRRRLEDMDRK